MHSAQRDLVQSGLVFDGDRLVAGGYEQAGEVPAPGERLRRADPHAGSEEALVMGRLRERPVQPRRRDLERPVDGQVAELVGDALTDAEIDPAGVVDVDAQALGTEALDG